MEKTKEPRSEIYPVTPNKCARFLYTIPECLLLLCLSDFFNRADGRKLLIDQHHWLVADDDAIGAADKLIARVDFNYFRQVGNLFMSIPEHLTAILQLAVEYNVSQPRRIQK